MKENQETSTMDQYLQQLANSSDDEVQWAITYLLLQRPKSSTELPSSIEGNSEILTIHSLYNMANEMKKEGIENHTTHLGHQGEGSSIYKNEHGTYIYSYTERGEENITFRFTDEFELFLRFAERSVHSERVRLKFQK